MNYQRILNRIRTHNALYGEHGETKEIQAERIRDKCIAKLRPDWNKRAEQVKHDAGLRLLRTFA